MCLDIREAEFTTTAPASQPTGHGCLAEAARLNKGVEIDCYPDRQDLNVELLELVRESGARLSLGTDAHHPWQLEFIELGLAAALKARISPERIINFLPLTDLRARTIELRAGHS